MIDFRMRKYFARLLLPCFLLWSALIPQNAYALVPASIGGYGLPSPGSVATASGGFGAAAAIGAVDLFAAAGLITVGAAISYFAIDYLVGTDKYTVRVPLTNTPALAVPAPYTPPTSPFIPAHVQYSAISTAHPRLWHDTKCLAFTDAMSWSSDATTTFNTVSCNESTNGVFNYTSGGVTSGNIAFPFGNLDTATSSITCETGYSYTGGACHLTNARLAVPDKACDLSRTGSALAMISDPDCTASGTAIPTICAADGTTCVGYGTAPNGGAPRSYVISPTADGGTQVTTFQQRTIGNTTVVDTTTIGVTADGRVGTISGGTQTGSIPNPQTSTAPAGSPATVSPSGGTQVQPSSTDPAQSITFPTDYARQGEAQTAANTLSPKLDTIHHDLSDTAPNVSDLSLPTAQDMPWYGNTFDGLKNWALPSHASECPKPHINLSGVLGAGHDYVLESHCQLVTDHFADLRAAFLVVWTVLALFVLLRA